jgi:hypothetical protein
VHLLDEFVIRKIREYDFVFTWSSPDGSAPGFQPSACQWLWRPLAGFVAAGESWMIRVRREKASGLNGAKSTAFRFWSIIVSYRLV